MVLAILFVVCLHIRPKSVESVMRQPPFITIGACSMGIKLPRGHYQQFVPTNNYGKNTLLPQGTKFAELCYNDKCQCKDNVNDTNLTWLKRF